MGRRSFPKPCTSEGRCLLRSSEPAAAHAARCDTPFEASRPRSAYVIALSVEERPDPFFSLTPIGLRKSSRSLGLSRPIADGVFARDVGRGYSTLAMGRQKSASDRWTRRLPISLPVRKGDQTPRELAYADFNGISALRGPLTGSSNSALRKDLG